MGIAKSSSVPALKSNLKFEASVVSFSTTRQNDGLPLKRYGMGE